MHKLDSDVKQFPLGQIADIARNALEEREKAFRHALTVAYSEGEKLSNLIYEMEQFCPKLLVDKTEPTRWQDYQDIISEFSTFCSSNDLCL